MFITIEITALLTLLSIIEYKLFNQDILYTSTSLKKNFIAPKIQIQVTSI